MARVTFYVQLVPEWTEGRNGDGSLNLFGVRAERMTSREPLTPLSGAVVVPVTLDVPDDLFGALDPVSGLITEGSDGSIHVVEE